MKKARKGFTLVELLIVVAILGILSVSMMMSVGGTTAKAKASMIASNFDSIRTAALAFYAVNINDPSVASGSLTPSSLDKYLSSRNEMFNNRAIKYTVGGTLTGSGTPSGKWFVSADFSSDPSSGDITTVLNSNAYPGISAANGKASMDIQPN